MSLDESSNERLPETTSFPKTNLSLRVTSSTHKLRGGRPEGRIQQLSTKAETEAPSPTHPRGCCQSCTSISEPQSPPQALGELLSPSILPSPANELPTQIHPRVRQHRDRSWSTFILTRVAVQFAPCLGACRSGPQVMAKVGLCLWLLLRLCHPLLSLPPLIGFCAFLQILFFSVKWGYLGM